MKSIGMSRGRAPLPRFMGALLWAAGWGCHPLRPSPPAVDDTKVETRAPELREIIDPTGRWRSQVNIQQVPKLHALPGHVRLDLTPGSPLVTNCFVYEQPILAGEATAQLLRAIAPGLRWNKFSPLEIEVLNHTPLVAFSLEFETTLGEKERGALAIFVFPRLEQPAMCSIEAALDSKQSSTAAEQHEAHRAVRQFLTNLTTTAPVPSARSELWLIQQHGSPVGFRQIRVETIGDAYVTTTQSSRFSLAPAAVLNADRIDTELEDVAGLRRMTWLQLTDGQVVFRGQMERQDDGYRFGVESQGARSAGRFNPAAPLLGSVKLHDALRGGGPGPWSGYYVPELRVDGPATCELLAPSVASERPCLSCTAQLEPPGLTALTVEPPPTQPKRTTLWFGAGPSQLPEPSDASAGCGAPAPSDSAAREESRLVAAQGAWPSF